MLFDLRSRGRRRTVQAVYLGLAVLMGGGLILFGVGAGNGFGGILNAFNGGGGSSAQKQVVSQQEKTALAQVKLQPNSAPAWGNLVEARFTNAEQGTKYNSTTGTFTSGGKAELQRMTQDWQTYLKLTNNKPESTLSVMAARAYGQLSDYSNQGHVHAREPRPGQGVRVPGRLRLCRQEDPNRRPRRREGAQPRAEGLPHLAQTGDRRGQDEPHGGAAVLVPRVATKLRLAPLGS